MAVSPILETKFPTSRGRSFRTDVQGMRAIAVLLVVLYHSGLSVLSGGYIGVDVFFVISGFLITSHLIDALMRTGKIQFGQFYAKRARRILPAALATAALTVVAAWIYMPPLLMKEVFLGAVATALYVPNVLFAVQGTNYLSESAPSLFQHFWSLGIEEQFYVFWPIILVLAFSLGKRSLRSLAIIVASLTAASFALCMVAMDESQPWSFFMLPSRAWELAAGGLLAFFIQRWGAKLTKSAGNVAFWSGLLVLGVAAFGFDAGTPFPGPYAVVPVIGAMLLIISGSGGSVPAGSGWLSAPPMLWVGKISYSLYLVHWPILVIPKAVAGFENTLPVGITMLLGAASFPLAWLLWKFIEEPARKHRFLVVLPRRTAFAAMAASIAVMAIAGGSWIASSSRVLDAGSLAPNASNVQSPRGTAYVPSNLSPSLRASSSDNPDIYASGCHRDASSTDASGCQFGPVDAPTTVAILGDSHAANWYPALREAADSARVRLDMNSKSECPAPSIGTSRGGVVYGECMQWRDAVIERLEREQPDVILLTNSNNYGPDDLAASGSIENVWADGLTETVERLGVASKVAILADVPNMGATPAICLSENLTDTAKCERSRTDSFNDALQEVERNVARKAKIPLIDLTSYLCNSKTCPAIIGNQLVYRDSNHLTATFSRSLSGILLDRIASI